MTEQNGWDLGTCGKATGEKEMLVKRARTKTTQTVDTKDGVTGDRNNSEQIDITGSYKEIRRKKYRDIHALHRSKVQLQRENCALKKHCFFKVYFLFAFVT